MKAERQAGIVSNPIRLSLIREGVAKLKDSSIFDFLRSQGLPNQAHPESVNFSAVMASEASRCLGYNQCIEDIEFFYEKYVEPTGIESLGIPDFGGLSRLLADKEISEDEYQQRMKARKGAN